MAEDARQGRRTRIGAEISSTEETVEVLAAGLGVCLVAADNVSLIAREGVVIRPITGIGPSQLVFAWRRGDDRPALNALRDAVHVTITATNRNQDRHEWWPRVWLPRVPAWSNAAKLVNEPATR